MSARCHALAVLAAMVVSLTLAACSSDADTASSTSAATTASQSSTAQSSPDLTTPDTAVAATDPASSAVTDDTTGPKTTAVTTTSVADTALPAAEPDTTVAPPPPLPDPLQGLPGIAALDVTVGGGDPTRPTFAWAAPARASMYQLVVQTADGKPLWAWTGEATEVVLGGEARPADVEGPTLEGPARLRVYALDQAGNLVAISAWVALPGA